MIVMVCNAGSTSLKFKVFDMPAERVLCQSKIERVGARNQAIIHYMNPLTGVQTVLEGMDIPDYKAGIRFFLNLLTTGETAVLPDVGKIERVGFKTVLAKGYYGVHELTPPVLTAMEDVMPLAPAHNGPYLEAIRTMREVLPETMFIGAFETAFHRTIPAERTLYGIPFSWQSRYGLCRLGFHGASHSYVAEILHEKRPVYTAVSCHLGGSSSLCAIKDGKSVDTSFGMSLQSGPLQSNRTGDMDWAVLPYLISQGLTLEEICHMLTKEGGLLGLSGVSNDLRDIKEAAERESERARLAIDVYVNGIVRYIGAFYAELGGLNFLVFTGGIGENMPWLRELVCAGLKHMGIELSKRRNAGGEPFRIISRNTSKVEVLVVPANEELGVARKTFQYSPG